MVNPGIIVAAIFAVVVAVVLTLYWLIVIKPEREFLERLKGGSGGEKRSRTAKLVRPDERDAAAETVERALVKTGGRWALNLRELCEQSGMKISVAGLLAMMLIFGLAAGFLTLTFVGFPVLAVLAAFLAAAAPHWYVSWVRYKRMLKFEEHFPEAIDLMARALRAGHALPTGIQMVADEMPAPIGTEFRILYEEQNFGLTIPDALRNFARRIPVLDARFFVTAVLTQREAGGNLAEVLDNLSSVIRDRFKVKRQIRVVSAHGRISGWVLAGLPPGLALALGILNPGYFTEMLGSGAGQQMIVAAIVLQVIGVLIMRKILNVEY